MNDRPAPEPVRPGVLLVIAAPLGAGKNLLRRALLQKRKQIRFCVPYTSRAPHPHEAHGQDFVFLSRDAFKKKADAGDFLEWVEIRGHYYGTPRRPLMDDLAAGRDAVLTVDMAGADSIKQAVPDAVRVFLCPSRWEEMVSLLKGRFPVAGPQMDKALERARHEIQAGMAFDYVLFHATFKDSTDDLCAILQAEQWRAGRVRPALERLLAGPIQ